MTSNDQLSYYSKQDDKYKYNTIKSNLNVYNNNNNNKKDK